MLISCMLRVDCVCMPPACVYTCQSGEEACITHAASHAKVIFRIIIHCITTSWSQWACVL